MKKPRANTTKRAAIFLDRDGVLNLDTGYVFKPNDLKILPGVPEGLSELKEAGYLLIVITNQSGAARGYFGIEEIKQFNELLKAKTGDLIDAFYVCPHHPDGSIPEFTVSCTCRKPAPGLVNQACQDFNVDPKRSFFIGDKDSDVRCGINAGTQTIQIVNERYPSSSLAGALVHDFSAAVRVILPTSAKKK